MIIAIVWSICVAASLIWNIHNLEQGNLEAARIQARASFLQDVIYRRWNAEHGGVYVPVTGKTLPNQYLNVEDRDITTRSGLELTMINPAYMTRQVHEFAAKSYGIYSHITSLNPIRPENAPDDWERKALEAFQKGTQEVSSVETIEGENYFRLMRSLITEKGCLKCHAIQGYKIGDVRGGISVAVPMSPFEIIEDSHRLTVSIGHAFLWLLGLLGLGFGAYSIGRRLSERDQAQEALQESEEKYRSILEDVVDNSDVGLFILDSEFRVVYINQALELYFDMKREEVVGKDKRRLIQEKIKHKFDNPEAFSEKVLAAYSQNTYSERFECYIKPGGVRKGRWVEHRSQPIRSGLYDGGRIELYYDLSKQKKFEEKLTQAKDEWEGTFNAVPDLIAILDDKHQIVKVNKPMAEKLGVSIEEAVGLTCYNYVHGTEEPPDYCPHSLFLRDGKEHIAEVFEKRLGGDFLVTVSPLPDPNGEPIKSVHVARDITNRKKAEEALRASEKKFRAIFEQAAVGVTLASSNTGQFFKVNQKFCDIVGYFKDELFSSSFQKITHPDDLQTDLDYMQQLMEGTINTFSMEKRYIRKDGTIIWVNLTVSPMWAIGEQPNFHIAIVEDITDRKYAEEALLLEKNKLQNALQKIKQLSGMLPICSSCKKIRDDKGYWKQIEAYIEDHSEAEFSHSICPDCAKILYPDLDIYDD